MTYKEIAEHFGYDSRTFHRWRNSEKKELKRRMDALEIMYMFYERGMNKYDILSLEEKNKELEEGINEYVDREERLRGMFKNGN